MALPIFDSLLGVAESVLEKVIPDTNQRAAIAHELATMGEKNTHALLQGQIEINKIEASSGKWWQSGWRPFFGWVCGIAFANNFIIAPYVELFGGSSLSLDWEAMSPVVLGMLGLAGMRSTEKIKRRSNG